MSSTQHHARPPRACSICANAIGGDFVVLESDCGHAFHQTCLLPRLREITTFMTPPVMNEALIVLGKEPLSFFKCPVASCPHLLTFVNVLQTPVTEAVLERMRVLAAGADGAAMISPQKCFSTLHRFEAVRKMEHTREINVVLANCVFMASQFDLTLYNKLRDEELGKTVFEEKTGIAYVERSRVAFMIFDELVQSHPFLFKFGNSDPRDRTKRIPYAQSPWANDETVLVRLASEFTGLCKAFYHQAEMWQLEKKHNQKIPFVMSWERHLLVIRLMEIATRTSKNPRSPMTPQSTPLHMLQSLKKEVARRKAILKARESASVTEGETANAAGRSGDQYGPSMPMGAAVDTANRGSTSSGAAVQSQVRVEPLSVFSEMQNPLQTAAASGRSAAENVTGHSETGGGGTHNTATPTKPAEKQRSPVDRISASGWQTTVPKKTQGAEAEARTVDEQEERPHEDGHVTIRAASVHVDEHTVSVQQQPRQKAKSGRAVPENALNHPVNTRDGGDTLNTSTMASGEVTSELAAECVPMSRSTSTSVAAENADPHGTENTSLSPPTGLKNKGKRPLTETADSSQPQTASENETTEKAESDEAPARPKPAQKRRKLDVDEEKGIRFLKIVLDTDAGKRAGQLVNLLEADGSRDEDLIRILKMVQDMKDTDEGLKLRVRRREIAIEPAVHKELGQLIDGVKVEDGWSMGLIHLLEKLREVRFLETLGVHGDPASILTAFLDPNAPERARQMIEKREAVGGGDEDLIRILTAVADMKDTDTLLELHIAKTEIGVKANFDEWFARQADVFESEGWNREFVQVLKAMADLSDRGTLLLHTVPADPESPIYVDD
ncbi:hypothetical protein HDU96_000921 [Phlyctochytrium bullatum]|nr:hypothetical protein HDU96_000921 [Phlyctochytrium bullatum]